MKELKIYLEVVPSVVLVSDPTVPSKSIGIPPPKEKINPS